MKRHLFFVFLLLIGFCAGAQDTTKVVHILEGTQRQRVETLPDGTQLQILAGTVGVRQDRTLFYCDSLVVNSQTKIMEAFGNIRIIDDTTRINAEYLRYHTDTRFAVLQRNVRLTDGRNRVTTNELEYDVATKIATYKTGGRVQAGKSVITSEEGTYYSDTKDIFFKRNVEMKDPSTYLKTDSIFYNTETKLARMITDTYIRDSSGRVIRTREGSYSVATRSATFTQRTSIEDKCLRVVGDQIASDDATGIVQIEGRAVLIDSCQGVNILADRIFANKKTGAYLATKKPLMIIRQDKDSIFVAADTLFSARLTDLVRSAEIRRQDSLVASALPLDSTKKDTVVIAKTPVPPPLKAKNGSKTKPPVAPKAPDPARDSANRYFEAYRNVRIYSDSLQAVGDSMFYSFRDSVFRLFQDPVVWNKKNQVTGDTIYLFTKNKKADRIRVFNNSFVASEVQPGIYNQMKSTRLDGYFRDGTIDSLRCKGFAETVYFLQDNDSAFTGINQTSADLMDVFFVKGDLQRVVYRSNVEGTVWPIRQKSPSELLLKGFGWYDKRRPKSKYDLFQ
ncbi:OstA family protein [Flaviaesturariibacter flavus]|uniref:OstA family protein n=1 Tax=Flaviaesturariibacter flavus TaxID=2502780 RepID=A0A4R1BNI8_9BACT|nr:OstA-like protein [Flaviaesturariibacter flavus]TCJ19099.1 OstA family protein [Flaviaesturariibacter flavus]